MVNWIKSQIAILCIAVIWLGLILTNLPLMIVAFLHDRITDKTDKETSWLYNLLVSQDIYVNTILGNYFRTTISSELGNLKRNGSGSGTLAANFVDYLFYLAVKEQNHCMNAIEAEDKHYFKASVAVLGMLSNLLSYLSIYFLFLK